jgi:hypothetical protein
MALILSTRTLYQGVIYGEKKILSGVAKIVDRLQKLADRHGPRFTPAEIIVEQADKGKSLY